MLMPALLMNAATRRIDTPVEVEDYRNDDILHTVLRNMAKG